MNNIDYSKYGGFPLTQDLLDFNQQGWQKPLIAFGELGGTTPHIISGMLDNGTTVSSGFLYYNGDIVPFIGGAIGATIVINTYKTLLSYGDGNSYQSQSRTEATFGVGAVQFNYSDLKTFQEGFGAKSMSGWQNLPIVTSASIAGSAQYHYNAMTKIVSIKGSIRVPQNYTLPGSGIMNQAINLPALINPSYSFYFRTSIETHGEVYLYSADGALFTGDVGRIDNTNSVLSISGRPLQGAPPSPYQNFYITYQL